MDPTGTIDLGNSTGIAVQATSSGNVIGGSATSDRNVIAGNNRPGVFLLGGGNTVQGISIGVSAAGTAGFAGSSVGISVANSLGT
ncbi:MAG: hypothetical protein ABR576_01005 [Thermoanaerobaculia bacterium]